jgi:hypothetical protein
VFVHATCTNTATTHMFTKFNCACQVHWVTKSVFSYSNGCSKNIAGSRRTFGGPRAARLPLVASLRRMLQQQSSSVGRAESYCKGDCCKSSRTPARMCIRRSYFAQNSFKSYSIVLNHVVECCSKGACFSWAVLSVQKGPWLENKASKSPRLYRAASLV